MLQRDLSLFPRTKLGSSLKKKTAYRWHKNIYPTGVPFSKLGSSGVTSTDFYGSFLIYLQGGNRYEQRDPNCANLDGTDTSISEAICGEE